MGVKTELVARHRDLSQERLSIHQVFTSYRFTSSVVVSRYYTAVLVGGREGGYSFLRGEPLSPHQLQQQQRQRTHLLPKLLFLDVFCFIGMLGCMRRNEAVEA